MVICDLVNTAYKRIICVCRRQQERFKNENEIRQELFNFGVNLSSTEVYVTAANFFDINKKNLFGVFATTTTYLIVVLQYNQKIQ